MLQLVNGFQDIGESKMFTGFDKPMNYLWLPTARQLFYGRYVKISIMKKFLKVGHVMCQKSPILADGVTAHRGLKWIDKSRKKFNSLLLSIYLFLF